MESKSQSEFTKLLKSSRPAIFTIITSLPVNGTHYNDIYQEVSMRAWAAYDGFKGESSFNTWICAIARYATIDKLRKLKKHEDELYQYRMHCLLTEHLADEPYSELTFPSTASLSEYEHKLLLMRLKGMPFKQISTNTGNSENKLRVHFHRIKQKLQKAAMMN